MARTATEMARNCEHRSLSERGSIHLPMLPDHAPRGTIRKSKSGKRRAIVLASVQLLMLAHIAMWLLSQKYGWFGGKTLTPVEPSEAMMFSKSGVINAGLIFFSVTLLSTLILGRWFCGWGCHIVMLQDFCSWIMKKCGVRPRLFRARFLMYVPFILAVYMFIMPAVHRWWLIPLDAKLAASWGADNWLVKSMRTVGEWTEFPLGVKLADWKVSSHLTTTGFWDTFPGGYSAWFIVPLFLFVCGFAVVYFLGAKGFCTYGCPYGGFFYPLDRFAVGKIRVTDACEHCGHCTTVCTSNVRVHEEVREYGMVVDPGCMKCLDCVSVCPNEALYFGFGAPSILKGQAKNEKPQKHYDLTLLEEFGITAVFIASFLAVRGVYDAVPMLMAVGVAGIVAFLAWKLWRMVRDASVTLHHFQLKFKGSIRPAGWIFSVLTALTFALVIQSAMVKRFHAIASAYDDKVTIPSDYVYSLSPMQMPDAMVADADQAIGYYTRSLGFRDGGIGLLTTAEPLVRLAWLYSCKHDYARAEQTLRAHLDRFGSNQSIYRSLGLIFRTQMKDDQAFSLYEQLVQDHPDYQFVRDELFFWYEQEGRIDQAIVTARRMNQRFPDDLYWMRRLSLLLVNHGDPAEGAAIVRKTIEIDPTSPFAYAVLSHALAKLGQYEEARTSLAKAIEMLPDNLNLLLEMAALLNQMGRPVEAAEFEAKANTLQQEQQARQAQTSPAPSP